MELVDKRLLKYIENNLESKGLDKDKFLHPDLSQLRDANLLFNMDKAVQKIKKAVEEHKKILIYGDYDSDGICSSTILYLYFMSLGVETGVFIPNRFENGYGISEDAIETLIAEFSPDLIITVDLGITAIEEVELLKQEGIDIVITDHHIPLEEIPDCIVVDPKLDPEKTYGFDGLCGAGVALKLVEALGGREEAMKYLDICAIATVGDIVPLIDENRVIAKFGINKINMGETLPSVRFLLNKLEISYLSSTDISFKIVPRLNACGRMDDAIKVFQFLIERDDKMLEKRYAEIEKDNVDRLSVIEKGTNIIKKKLETYDRTEPSVLVVGEFHEGVLGILASRISHEFNKPAIIFTQDENGYLKGSGRSVSNIDIHKIISSLSGLLVNFGGHKMACGLTISPDSFDAFKEAFNNKIREDYSPEDFLINETKYDIELTDDDLCDTFAEQLAILEPFGCDNEKPVLAIRQNKLLVEPINEKAFKHFKYFTRKNKIILAFNGYNTLSTCKSNSEKLIFLDVGFSYFKNRKNLSIISRGVKLIDPVFDDTSSQDILSALYNKYFSIFDYNNVDNYHLCDNMAQVVKEKFSEGIYGTLVVVSSKADLDYLTAAGINVKKYLSCLPIKNGQNTILVGSRQIYSIEMAEGYKNIIFMHRYFDDEHLYFSQKFNVYENANKLQLNISLSKERDVFVKVYKLLNAFSDIKANDVLEFAEKLAQRDRTLSAAQVLFCLIVFMELNFIEFDEKLSAMNVVSSKKMELSSSKFYNQVR